MGYRGRGYVVIGILSICIFLCGLETFSSPTLLPTDANPEATVTIIIQHRVFRPSLIHLRTGRKTRLIIQNHDAELHAFVPIDFLKRTSVQVSGNGAPEFGRDGFRRVLIPSAGQAELLFIPRQSGTYAFSCDLPGHVMAGTIVVEE
ncbi:MAG: hypothetical protein D6704_07315 [Nitrospirae bacterium]|nr:MAG: hypothetical protein D6704_07315 [Nitrospirota bacterium]